MLPFTARISFTPLIVVIGDVDVSAPVHRNAGGEAESAAQDVDGGGTGGDAAIDRQNLLHLGVVGIGDEYVPVLIHRHAIRGGESAAQGVDHGISTGRQNLLHRAVALIGDEYVPVLIHRDAPGL